MRTYVYFNLSIVSYLETVATVTSPPFCSFKDKGFEDAKVVIAALRNKGISTIGAAGFCWGGEELLITLLCVEIYL